MAALKTMFVLVLMAVVLASSMADVHVGPCDQVCPRIVPERAECCRAHGFSGYSGCWGGWMYCE